jgi:hypothetical protein
LQAGDPLHHPRDAADRLLDKTQSQDCGAPDRLLDKTQSQAFGAADCLRRPGSSGY